MQLHDLTAIEAADDPATLPPLLGVPTAIKDLNLTKGIVTQLGSRVYTDNVSTLDDYIVESLREAGTISLGKTATPEFGLPCYTETDIGPPACTPWDPARSAGGSSGGAAAAVAGGFVPFAQGSDGGGSIRIPASACGLVGLKTSRGRVSKGPLDVDATWLAVLGPLARTVRDAAAFLDAVAAPGRVTPDPLPLPGEPFRIACDREPGRLRIGRFIEAPIESDVDPQVRDAWEQASRLLADLGHEVLDIDSPMPPDAVPAFETAWAVSATGAPVDPARESELRPLTRHLRERGRAISGPQYAGHRRARGVLTPGHRRDGAPARRAHPDVGPAAAADRLVRPGRRPGSGLRAADAIHPVHRRGERHRPAGHLAAAVPERRGPADRRDAGRTARRRATLLRLGAQLEAALP